MDREFGIKFAWDIDLLGGYDHHFLNTNEPYDLSRFRGVQLREDLSVRIRDRAITHIWIEGWRFDALWNALKIAKRNKVQTWLRGETNVLRTVPLWKQCAKRIVLGRHLKQVDRFLCIGTSNQKFYETMGASPKSFVQTPYCVDNDRFREQANRLRHERSAIRAGWKIPAEAKVVLFCGKLIDKKHPHHLIEAADRVRAHVPNIHLLFAGTGSLQESLMSKCNVCFSHDSSASKSSNGVSASFVGFLNQTEVAKAYVAADVLVLPSDAGETWGLVVNEAMACGLPAIVSDLVGCSEDLPRQLDSACRYPFGDIDQLAKSMTSAFMANWTLQQVMDIADRCHLRHTVTTVRKLLSPN